MDDRRLIRIHADILFTYDERDRMVTSREPDGRPAPRVLLCQTQDDYILRFGQTVPDDIADRVASTVQAQWSPGHLRTPAPLSEAIKQVLEEHSPVAREEGGPIYRFPDSLPASDDVVQVTDQNLEITRDTFPWLLDELPEWWPCFAVVRGGAAISVCFSARIGPFANEAGVVTLPAFRGRGFAPAVASAWAAAIRADNRIPLYSTSWDNLASQAVARRLGLRMIGAESSWV